MTSARTVPWITLDFAPMRRQLRKLHIREADLADSLGVAPSTVNRWITGARCPPSYRIPALTMALGVPFHELVNVEEGHRDLPERPTPPGGRRGRPTTHPAAAESQEAEGIQP